MWDDLLHAQHHVVSRAQVLAAGFSLDVIRANLRARRWRRLFPGVYATFTGPLPRRARMWAALLRAGAGAMLSHHSAAELQGLVERPPQVIHLTVPTDRRVRPIPGVVVHRSARARSVRHPTRTPPQTRVEETVLDLTQVASSLDEAIGWLSRAVGARRTMPDRLAAAMEERTRVRWRRPLRAALADVDDGCHSLLEVRYLHLVERAHGLPRADRQSPTSAGPRRFRDVCYGQYDTVVELDGRAAHPEQLKWRDMRRDNSEAERGNRPLRYGWGDIEELPCATAVQVGNVLRRGGWSGRPHPCRRPGCAVGRARPAP